MKNSLQLQDERAQLKKRAFEMIDQCKVEIRKFNEEETSEYESIKTQIININEELRKLNNELEKEVPNEKQNENLNKEENKTKNTMEKNFSLIKAIRSIANNQKMDDVTSAVVNAGQNEMRKAGISASGQIQLPTEMRADITVTAEGEDVVKVDMFDIMTPLRQKLVLTEAGAKFLNGLVGDVQVPIMGAGNVAWEGETAAAKDANITFSNVKLTPKRLTAYIDLSKQFLAQDSLSAEALIREDLVNAIACKLESTILGEGKGSGTEPAGIFSGQAEAPTIADFKGICDLEAGVEDANVLGECKYVMSNKAKAVFRNMAKSTKTTQLVMEGGAIDGTQVFATSGVANKNIAYGDFSNLAIGSWSGLDLTVDPYTLAKDGKVRIVVNAFFDAKVLRPSAIKIAKVA